MSSGRPPRHLLVVGNGMVGQRLVDELVAADVDQDWTITVVGEESRPAYDRVALSSWFDGRTELDLRLVSETLLDGDRVAYRLGHTVDRLDTENGVAHLDDGTELRYDEVVIATGSSPFVPPIPGHELPGTFVYRTLDDLEAIKAWAEADGRRSGIVVGGGLLGLEAANALLNLGLEVDVVEMAPFPMPQQLGEGGGRMLARWVESLGVRLHCGVTSDEFVAGDDGNVAALRLADGRELTTDLVVFSAGVRPRDQLARASGIEVGERGGIVVDDALRTPQPNVSAIGEVALHRGRVYGLVAPGYEMARAVARRLTGSDESSYEGSDLSTKLKLLGVDVACFGAANAAGEAVDEIVYHDPVNKIFRRLVLDVDTGALLGGALVGDISGYELLTAITLGQAVQPDDLPAYVLPASVRPPDEGALPDGAQLCSCNAVSVGTIREAIGDGCSTLGELKDSTCAGTSCGGCVPALTSLLKTELAASGIEVSKALCEHFDHSRQELFDLVRFHRYTTWADVLANHGRGNGCEICRPTVGSILASLSNGYILDGDQVTLQDTNDLHLANMQRDGTYSVVPRVPGGEITPDQLIALGQIAKDFDLYTKITGGQRIDLFGARLGDLPTIWQRVIDAGMESGHAYGKSLRTVKSCVGSTWCRYGVQDSVGMAILVEQRYRGLRSPHKIKMAVSGCTRECAEAQSKDVGVIATEHGWNLYVCGNGGRSPRHADLLAGDLTDEQLIRAIDRFLMFYIRTADRLQRTSSWFEELDGGLDHLRAVVFDDVLGIADELEDDMQRHIDTYECEWKATLDDPERLAHFVEFVNAPDAASTPTRVEVRGQRVPA
ncbi:nitrite reductase (NADH) large subunit [Ilumatobacter fluminis]|uniref:assimilatory sulfite reductase (ferredoxin) n=1 Tax=Ilumatobacter fluminis TaxID=467091 RepID=A0A4R7I3L7_9ACTN|nr:nitrite reductase large subunit NirB [Ilumatobacter fluminis]TDT18181.1 nitrite reductase (NADH) large subunit [Ilumatobacter fluminis]